MRSRCYRLVIWLVIVTGVVVADQISKWLILQHLIPGESYHLLPWLNLNLIHNSGAAFGMLQRAGGWQRWIFSAVAIIVTLAIIVMLIRMPTQRRWQPFALSLILGGALGNLCDRLLLGYVNDFIDFHIQSWHFATFNVADAAITIGVLLLIITLLREQTENTKRGQTD